MEERFLRSYDSAQYERPSVAVDLLLLTIEDGQLRVLLERRAEPPYEGCWALPGVFVGLQESLETAVARCLSEETGLSDIFFEQLYTWGDVGRDPRLRVISVSYMALVPAVRLHPVAGRRVQEVGWFAVPEALPAMAFDHARMLRCAVERLRGKVDYTDIAFHFVPPRFTLPELQRVYEILLGHELYKANFRKKILPRVRATEKLTQGESHRPSRLYEYRGGSCEEEKHNDA